MTINLLGSEEIALLEAFNALSAEGKKIYLQFMTKLLELPTNRTQEDIDSLIVEYQHKLFAA